MTANEALISEIVDMGLGFDIPDVETALIATGNKSAEVAVEYLFNWKTSSHNNDSNNTTHQNNKPNAIVTSSDIEALKKKLQSMNLKLNVTLQLMEEALKKNHNNKDDALYWLLNNYSQTNNNDTAQRFSHLPSSTSTISSQQSLQNQNSKTDISNVNQHPTTKTAINIHSSKDVENLQKKMKDEAQLKKNERKRRRKTKTIEITTRS